MRARLLMVNPDLNEGPPGIPTLIVEDGDVVGLFQDDRAIRIEVESLEDITREDLPEALHLQPLDVVSFSRIRDLPSEDLMSPQVMTFCHSWWRESMSEAQSVQKLARAS